GCLDTTAVTFDRHERRPVDRSLIAPTDHRNVPEGQQAGHRSPIRPGETGLRFVDLQAPAATHGIDGQFRAFTLPLPFSHEINSKTPPTRMTTDRRGRNREEAEYERGRCLGRRATPLGRSHFRRFTRYPHQSECQEAARDFSWENPRTNGETRTG